MTLDAITYWVMYLAISPAQPAQWTEKTGQDGLLLYASYQLIGDIMGSSEEALGLGSMKAYIFLG